MGFVKGKSAIHIAQVWGGRKPQYLGRHFWVQGCCLSTVGRDEVAVRAYISEQEKEDHLDRMRVQPVLLDPCRIGFHHITLERAHPPLGHLAPGRIPPRQ
jgi:hypothetical protein